MILEQNQVRIDMAAGGETAGIPFSAYIAMELSKPMLYVRKARKGYGIANLVEGGNPSGSKVLLVEDLITDAGNKLHFIEAIREAGGIVEDVLVLFDRLQGGAETLLEHGVKLHAVSNMNSALEAAYVSGICLKTDLDSVRKYLDDQKSWHVERGLEFLE